MCTLSSILQSDSCLNAAGGIKSFYLLPFADLDSITNGVGANEVSAISLTVTGTPVIYKFEPDEEEATYTQTSERLSSRSVSVSQTITGNFISVSSAEVLNIDNLNNCCKGFLAFVVCNQEDANGNPLIFMSGIRLQGVAGGFRQTQKALRTDAVEVNMQTLGTDSRVTLNLMCVDPSFAPVFTGSEADLDALM